MDSSSTATECDCFALSGGSYGAHDPACPNASATSTPDTFAALEAVAWSAVDAWALDPERLDERMETLRGFLKGKSEDVEHGLKLAETMWE